MKQAVHIGKPFLQINVYLQFIPVYRKCLYLCRSHWSAITQTKVYYDQSSREYNPGYLQRSRVHGRSLWTAVPVLLVHDIRVLLRPAASSGKPHPNFIVYPANVEYLMVGCLSKQTEQLSPRWPAVKTASFRHRLTYELTDYNDQSGQWAVVKMLQSVPLGHMDGPPGSNALDSLQSHQHLLTTMNYAKVMSTT